MFNVISIAFLVAMIFFIVDLLIEIYQRITSIKFENNVRLCKNAIAVTLLSTLNDCLIDANKKIKNANEEKTEETK